MRPLSKPQLALLEELTGGEITPVGQEVLTGLALSRRGMAAWRHVTLLGSSRVLSYLSITEAGLKALLDAKTPKGTIQIGIRLPVEVQPHLDRGKARHGTATGAVVHALKQAYPERKAGTRKK